MTNGITTLPAPVIIPPSSVPIKVKQFRISDDISINSSDRILVVGRSGSGKSVLVKAVLLPNYDNYVFWDIKKENNDIIHDALVKTPAGLKYALDRYNKILYQPASVEMDDFDAICRLIFEHKNMMLYVDEATRVSSPMKIPYWLNVIVTQGRSVNVGLIAASQRPKNISNTIISESLHFFIFGLNMATDRERMAEMMGKEAANEIQYLPQFHFMYYSVLDNRTILYKPILSAPGRRPRMEIYKPTLADYMKRSGGAMYE